MSTATHTNYFCLFSVPIHYKPTTMNDDDDDDSESDETVCCNINTQGKLK